MSVPNRRGHIATEQRNTRSAQLDKLTVRETLELINSEDATVPSVVRAALPRIERFVEMVVASFRAGGRLVYVGAGTSGRLGVLDASECPPSFSVVPGMVAGVIAGGAPALTRAVEGAEDNPEDGAAAVKDLDLSQDDSVLGIATGGTTPFVHGALQYAMKIGASTGFLICTDEKPFADLAEVMIPVITGPEVVTGSTRMKAGTATKLVLNMITTTAMVQINKTYGDLMVDLKALNDKLWDRGSRIISELTELSYEQAFKTLKQADGEVKTALAMELKGLSSKEARQKLDKAGGALRKVLEGD
ncbi:MAG: N-acetylmuramic acid 6-phosphate etherase [Candidatus Marinimicrobia bacterium]|nr:N-acetylmuramic acid 6-phosphate etherase [Candidatus Neomarinimicrobiota bacterium]